MAIDATGAREGGYRREVEVSDWDLVIAWKAGDDEAATRLAHRYFALLMRFFLNKVRDPEDATDLVSETFLGCCVGRDRATMLGSFRSFLFAVAMNKLRGYFRKLAKRERERLDFEELCVAQSLPRSPSSIVARAQQTKLLVNALRRLTMVQQIVVELSYFEELSGNEIAELLGMPRATVHTHLHRGRRRLAEIVGAMSEDPALAESTISGLDTWVSEVRARIGTG